MSEKYLYIGLKDLKSTQKALGIFKVIETNLFLLSTYRSKKTFVFDFIIMLINFSLIFFALK